MKSGDLFAHAAGILLLSALPALAEDPASPAKPPSRDDIAGKVQEATAKHTSILTELLTTVPEGAKASVGKAIEASRKGQEAAAAALTKPRPAKPVAEASTAGSGRPAESGKPAVTGVEQARAAVAEAFQHSSTALEKVIGEVPEPAAARVREALTRIQEQRASALANLDRLIAMERPERPERPERGERPAAPERAERPEPPARPERPDPPKP